MHFRTLYSSRHDFSMVLIIKIHGSKNVLVIFRLYRSPHGYTLTFLVRGQFSAIRNVSLEQSASCGNGLGFNKCRFPVILVIVIPFVTFIVKVKQIILHKILLFSKLPEFEDPFMEQLGQEVENYGDLGLRLY